MERRLAGPIGLVVHPKRDLDRALAAVQEWAEGHGITVGQVVVDGVDRRVADPIPAEDCDMLVALGGDGTTLAALHASAASAQPVLGVACGSIGALTSVHADDVEHALDRVAEGEWTRRDLMALEVNCDKTRIAVNDFAIVRNGMGQVITSISVDGQLYARSAGDGIIVATPTGSSAYSMAAGGPLLTTACDAFVATPLAAHGGSVRPLVIDGERELTLELQPGFGGMRLEVDGQRTDSESTRLTVRRRRAYATLVALGRGDEMLAGLRQRALVTDSPRAKLREEREERAARPG